MPVLSFRAYLAHIVVLNPVYVLLQPVLTDPSVTIPVVTIGIIILAYVLIKVLYLIPVSKVFVG